MTGAPNFAYDMCIRRIPPQDRAELDLSNLRVAFSGAEPIRAATLWGFAESYRACGLDPTALMAAYGLAEVTLIATASTLRSYPTTVRVCSEALQRGQIVPGDDRTLIGVGSPRLHRRVEIVDPTTHEALADGTVGEIWLAGHDVAVGYWGRPEETARTFSAYLAGSGEGPFLRTGDTGVKYRGELFIAGRIKDIVIVGGLNHYPQDIELTVESAHDWIRPGCTAVFACEPNGSSETEQERVVVVAEVQRPLVGSTKMPNVEDLTRSVRGAVSSAHGIQLHDILFVTIGSVPKTSSGKLQRAMCRSYYERAELTLARLPATRELKEVH